MTEANKEWAISEAMLMGQFTADEDGAWKTINGAHVFIENGEITKGPDALTGKKSGGNSESSNNNGILKAKDLPTEPGDKDVGPDDIRVKKSKPIWLATGKEGLEIARQQFGEDFIGKKLPSNTNYEAGAYGMLVDGKNHMLYHSKAGGDMYVLARNEEALKSIEAKVQKHISKETAKLKSEINKLSREESLLRSSVDTPRNTLMMPNGTEISKAEYSERMKGLIEKNKTATAQLKSMGVKLKEGEIRSGAPSESAMRKARAALRASETQDSMPEWELVSRMTVGDFNPYHNPDDGRFTSGNGASSDWDDEDEDENDGAASLRSMTEGAWWGRRSDLEDELEEAGFSVEESNGEYITVSGSDDTEYQLVLGGTPTTITVNRIRTFDSIVGKGEWALVKRMMVGDFNPNHDPENGQFTTGSGGSSAGSENAKPKRLPRGRGHEMIAHSDNFTPEQHSYLQDLEGQAYEFLEERCEENGEDFMDLWGVSEPYEEDGITYVDAEYNVVTKSGKRVDRASQVPVSPKNKKATSKADGKMKDPAGYFKQASKMSGLKPMLDQMDKASKGSVSKAVYKAAASPDGGDTTLQFGRKSVKVTAPSKDKRVAKQYGIHWTDRRGTPNASYHGEAGDLATHLLITLKDLGYNGEQITIK